MYAPGHKERDNSRRNCKLCLFYLEELGSFKEKSGRWSPKKTIGDTQQMWNLITRNNFCLNIKGGDTSIHQKPGLLAGVLRHQLHFISFQLKVIKSWIITKKLDYSENDNIVKQISPKEKRQA